MKLLLIALLAATTACKKSEPPAAKKAEPVAEVGSAAPAADPWAKPEAKKDPLPNPLFWSLEKDGKTSYVLGTMHLGVDAASRLPDYVWKKLEESKTFAMETDTANAGAKINPLRKDGKTLQQELGPEYWTKLEDAIGAQDAARVLNFKAWLPATLLSMRGLPETAPMDGVLHGRALNLKKNIVFLEPVEHQAGILEKWMNAQALKDMLDDVPGLEQRSKEMLAAYIAGDGGKLLAIADSERERHVKRGRPVKEYDDQMEDLLYKRNASWIEPIEKLHADGGGFIAVGALHAVGPRSILEHLEKKGFKVTRVTQ